MIQTNSGVRVNSPCHLVSKGGPPKQASEKKIPAKVKKSAVAIYKKPHETAAAASPPAQPVIFEASRRRFFLADQAHGAKEQALINDSMNLGQCVASVARREKLLDWALDSGTMTVRQTAEVLLSSPNLRVFLDSPCSAVRGTRLSKNQE